MRAETYINIAKADNYFHSIGCCEGEMGTGMKVIGLSAVAGGVVGFFVGEGLGSIPGFFIGGIIGFGGLIAYDKWNKFKENKKVTNLTGSESDPLLSINKVGPKTISGMQKV